MKNKQFSKALTGTTGKDLLTLIEKKENLTLKKDTTIHLNPTELAVSVFWKNLLGHDNYDVNDDFFRVGGNSLKAIQLLSRISAQFSVHISLTDIFLQPTIAQIAKMVDVRQIDQFSLSAFIEVKERPEYIPLSFNQERLWFIDQLEGSVQYHIPAVFRLKGKLNNEALAFAFRQIINRHEVLRTVILEKEGQGYQFIQHSNGWKLSFSSHSAFKNDIKALQQHVQQLINQPFDLSKDYLLRAGLVGISEEEHVLVVTLHHIASDGWSTSIIVKELAESYKNFQEGVNTHPVPLLLQYADYSIWQRQYLHGIKLDEKLAYWRKKLEKITPLQLPTDFARPAIQSFNGAFVDFAISKDLTDQLRLLSQQQGVTLFMTLLATFKVLLFRYTAQQDITVGTAMAGRQRQELEALIGFFVNTLALRTHIDKEMPFVDLLNEVKITTLEAFEHQELPFEKVVEAVVKERDLSTTPLFQVMFVLQNTPGRQPVRLGELTLSEESFEKNKAKYELDISLTETEHGLQGSVEYCTDLYSEKTIKRMLAHFKQLLNSVVKTPGQCIGLLPMLSSREEMELLLEFNDTVAAYPRTENIVSLFEEQVLKNPAAIAVVFGEQYLSYEELNERSNQLAHYLLEQGVKADKLVPICIDRSPEMIIGIIGILKAGGAYVPIDPEYPVERIQFMVEDSASSVVLVGKDSISRIISAKEIIIVVLDEEGAFADQPGTNLQVSIQPHQLAYIIYTSGSTGKPKGVMIEHRNVVRLFKTEPALYDFNETDVWTVFHSFCFDFSVWEMYGALLYGGRMVVVPRHVTKDVTQFAALLLTEKVTVLNQTPSAFYILQDVLVEKAKKVPMRYVIFGGEALNPAKLQPWKKLYPGSKLVNMYGITETTVHVSFQEIEWQHILAGKSIVGKPIPTLSAYILDGDYSLVPVGVAGELMISGAGLARGYLNRPDLTAEKFIRDPFSINEDARMYRTGDLGRWLANGTIEYLGRIDEQVKIRGYRIELGEIEACMLSAGGIRNAKVVVLENENTFGKKLCAYLEIDTGQLSLENSPEITRQLRARLEKQLPDYMIPADFILLDQFPLTSNGKIDKKALPLPGKNDNAEHEYEAPQTALEIALVSIWEELLGKEKIGISDNFFELGGHSLLAMRVKSAVRKELGIEVDIKMLFLHTTISDLARELQANHKGLLAPPPIIARERPKHIPLSFSQERLWVIDRLVGSLPYHVPAVLRLKGNLNKDALAYALQQIVNRHEVLRTIFPGKNGKAYQLITEKDNWQLSIADGSKFNEESAPSQKFIEGLIREPFDLTKDSMLRVTLIPLDEKDYLLVITMHHIASDAWSLSVLMKEVMELYNSLEEGRPPLLAPLEIQYADYTLWQLEQQQNLPQDQNLEYWKAKLGDIVPQQIPTDFARPVTRSTNGASYSFLIEKELSNQLQVVSNNESCTLFMVLLTAFKTLLYRYSGVQDICVGTSIANRTHREVEGLIGFFVNTLALRTEVSGDISFTDLLYKVKSTTLEAYQHQDTPFEKVVEAVTKERGISRSPLFQVMLVMPNTPDVQDFHLGELEISAETFSHNTSKFDITFFIVESTDGLQCTVEYSTDLYHDATIQRMAAHFETLLASVIKNPHQKIGILPMLTGGERRQLLEEFNDSRLAYPKDKTIVDLFEEQVVKTPFADALVFEGDTISYQQLNERANQLAHYLRSMGVKEESLVPVFMERGPGMMVAILGILKAGAAYVPVDAEFPADRISYMLEDTGSSILIADTEGRSKLAPQTGVDIIEIDGNPAMLRLQPIQNVKTFLLPGNAAYVIYTSGSTGKPKGVTIEHRNLVDYIFGLNNKVQINECKSFALVSTIATDLGNTVIYASLLSGGALHLFSKDATTNVEMLHEYFSRHQVECLKIVPSHWKALCMENELLLPARLIIFGGEALRSEMVEKIQVAAPACRVVNHYGPTETTIGKLLHLVEPGRKYGNTIPIGKPFSNTRVYVLSRDMQLCPVGIPGQLFIAGDGVARGYFNKPEITKEKFVPDVFTEQPGSLMYGTGDLVKYLPGGNIEFIGRVDDQVKIRGYRIELGEIEMVINQCGLVSQAVVLAREDKQGNKRLVAYIVPEGSFEKDEIVAYIKEKLPEYMIPALLVRLEALPLTANGKVDRKSLPDPDAAEMHTNEYAAPRNDAEKALVEIWQELLDVASVGIHDNFFELGGDSIITIQLVSRARRAGYELQMGDVFTYQTIARLSALLDQRTGTTAGIAGEQFLLEGASGLLPIQQWYFEKDSVEISHFNQSVLLTIDKSITESLLRRAIEQLAAHHDALRFKYYKKDGSWYQVYELQAEINRLVMEDLRSVSLDELPGRITNCCDNYQRSLDIEKGELIRVVLLQTPLSENANRLLLVIHHLAMDGVSWRILLEDLELLLSGLKNAGATELGNKTTSYRQWYSTLEKYGQSKQLLSQKTYWDNVVSNYQSLPVDTEYNEPVKLKDTSHYAMRLGAAQTRLLTHDVPRVYHTEINDILMAALAKTLTEFGDTGKVVIGMEGHGRESIEECIDTSRTVGWFTTHYPILIEVNSDKGIDGLIKNTKEQLRQVPGKGLGFGVLKYINKEELYQGKPCWDILFNYLGQVDNVLNSGQWLGIAAESAGQERSTEYILDEKLAVNGMIQAGELVLNWTYSNKHYQKDTVTRLVKKFRENLELLITHCIDQQKKSGVVFTPSDYGFGPEISYTELDRFLNEPINGKARKESMDSIYKLSGLQQGMLFHGLYDGDGAGYLNHFWCDLIKPDINILRKSWNYVMQTHTILRSAFHYDAFSIPVQSVQKEIKLPIGVIDLQGMNEADQAMAIRQFEEADRAKGFDFKTGPLMRISLLRLNENRYRMLWTSHHILFDGWSRSILMGEFLKIYETLVCGKPTPPVTEDRYEDYIRYIEGIDKDKEQFYWENYLKPVQHSTLLPFIRTTAERNKGAALYGSVLLDINKEITAQVEQFAQRHRITINTLMQGVWSYLLHRYTGGDDIVYGVIVSGRPDDLPHVEQRIGMFINALPMYSCFKEEQKIVEWLQGIQNDQVGSRHYQYTPLRDIQAWTGVPGDLFDSLLVFENYPVNKVLTSMKGSLEVENVRINEQTNYPLTLLINNAGEINIDFSYNRNLLEEVHVKGIRDHFEHVLLQLIEIGETRMKGIELLTETGKQQLIYGFNNTVADYPRDKTLIGLFEEQVEKTPDAIALVFESQQLTYKELDENANQLAHYLRNKGVKEETLVPICLDRSLEMSIGILGILKAGGAYVPIDPEYPGERIGYMLEDTTASIVLTTDECKTKLPPAGIYTLITLDGDWPEISKQPVSRVENKLASVNLAYVIYTSGSTGKPKGVMNEHGGVVNRLFWAQDYYRLSAGDVVLQKTSFSFDVSVWELLWPLLSGAKLVFAKPGGHKDAGYLREMIDKEKITMIHFVPSMLGVFLSDIQAGDCKGLTKVLCSGEALKKSQVALFVEKLGHAELHNLYGPTEAAIDVTYWSLDGKGEELSVIPIGKPVANTAIYILDKHNALTPMGAIGEIHIAGVQVARGYLNRAELTAERFVKDPFGKKNGARMYRTGDLGRWLTDGNLEYLGRIDEQVKIRGFRIELGDIETCISASDGVMNAKVVVMENDASFGKKLCAYVEIDANKLSLENSPAIIQQLRATLGKQLPDYMVPTDIVLLDKFPLTSNGKIDKKALPLPESTGAGQYEYEAPQTPLEIALVTIWEKLLEKERIGVHDNFFELGGHSLLAMRFISALRRELQKEMAIKMLFLYPTIKELADRLENHLEDSSLPGITAHTRPAHIPLSFSQERLWFIDKLEGTQHYHLPFVVRLKGMLDKDALGDALLQIVSRHEILRTVILEEQGTGYQHIKEIDGWHLNITEELVFDDGAEDLQQYIRQLIKTPFNLSADYMLRAHLLPVGDSDHLLVATVHHIASDGWSTSVIVKELMELYAACEEGRPVQLPALNIQYADYSIWQRNYLQGAFLDQKLGYWKNKLEGVATLQLPTDYPRPAVQSNRGARTFFNIDRELTEQLQLLSQHSGTTLFMTLLAAYKVLLHRYSGQMDICVGTPIANRTQHELESLIGFFINTLAIRSNLEDNPSFSGLLHQVKASTLEAYEHQDMPFEKIVEAVVKERDMGRNPLFQVLFTMQNTPKVPELRLGAISLSLEELEHTTSQLDIICNISETADGLSGSVEFCTDLYKEQTIQCMMGHFRELLRSIVKAPQQRIGELPMLSQVQEHKLLVEFNDTAVSYPTGATIISLFEAQVAANPAKLAAVFEEEQLDFRELNERANQLASYLKLRGVKEQQLVPICIERSIDMLVSIWAILKAGAAYVPIDPAYPVERINYMLQDTGATIVVSSSESLPKLSNEDLDIVMIDNDWSLISMQPVKNLSISIEPAQLAYVIYTSGSTGKPKGVMIEHRNLISYLLNDKTKYINAELTGAGSFIHLSCTFDASLTAMFMPLLAGKPVVIGSKSSADVFEDTNLQKFAPYDFIKITPSHLALLQFKMKTNNGGLLTKKLVIGGEALFPGQFSYLAEEGLDVEIINEYGPTEATVGCSVFDFHTIGDNEKFKNGISIGKPIDNVQLYILGPWNELLPAGAAGELCIGGAGLARGYLNRSDLTKEKFIKDPFSKNEGARIYKTGDLARWLPNGNIEYLGRKDEQVKIRGFRIELGEIEGVLQECTLVNQAVVLAKENKEGNRSLVAYIVPESSFDKEAIREYLKNILPEYMVPVQWVVLDSLPLTSNGKVDRKSLPHPDASELPGNRYVAPRNDFEKTLAVIWQELLDVEAAGIHDNFFELGGDSIVIIQIVSRARRAGYEFLVSDVFTHQTIAGLSAMMDQKTGNLSVVPDEKSMLTGESGLLPIQHWFFETVKTGISYFNQSVLLAINKKITESDLRYVLERLTAHHDALRFVYHQENGEWKQQYGTDKGLLVVEDLPGATADTLGTLVEEMAQFYQRTLDIEKGEIVKMVLMQTPASSEHNRLFIVIHHLAVDGISWRILLEDIELLLTGLKTNKQAELGPETSSYRRWHEALEKYGRSPNLMSQSLYWEKAVSNYDPLLTDKNYNGVVRSKDIGLHTINLSEAQTKTLLKEVPKVYHTEINDILLGALALTLCNWQDRDNVVIGMEGHGREDIEKGIDTSRTVGWFTSLYPVLLEVDSARSIPAIIKGIKEQLRRVPDKGVGYGVLKYINKDEKFVSKKCWDIAFNYFGQLDNVVNTGQWLSPASESKGAGIGEEHAVNDLLSINGMVQGGELVLSWRYSQLHFESASIEDLAVQYKNNIGLLIAHCNEQQKSGIVFTPSDYGLGAEITNTELDTFLNEPMKESTRRQYIETLYRLSGLQQGMLFHGLYDKRAGAYIEQFGCDLRTPDLQAIGKSWEHILKRHSILRSGFYYDAFAVPVQCVFHEVDLPITMVDYSDLDEDEKSAAIKKYELADQAQGFDFKSVPLMRIALIRMSEDGYRMLWTSHHILFDGWSLQVLMEEFLNTYDLLVEGRQLLKDEEDKYGDYIRYLERLDKEQEENYWSNYLKGVEQSTLLPFIAATSERTKGVGVYKSLSLRFDAGITECTERFVKHHHITVNTLMQGVWAYLLHKYTGNQNIVFGVTVSGRPDDLPGIERRVGMYINTLPLHSKLEDGQDIGGWLQSLQQTQFSSREYQYTPLHRVQEWSTVQGDLFDSLLVFENYPVSKVIASRKWSLEVDNVRIAEQTNYPLTITIGISDDIRIGFHYNSRLLKEVYVKEIKDHFENVFLQIVNEKTDTVGGINLLTLPGQHQLLSVFNDTQTPYKHSKTVVDLFGEQVLKTPTALAVAFKGEQLTYQQLNNRSNQLAHYLKSKGVKEETLVPVCIDRSIEMMTGILGILKAGAAYVPIDPGYPQERINYMLEDTGAAIIVTNKVNSSKFGDVKNIDIVKLDGDDPVLSAQPEDNIKIATGPHTLAYVIYTSGSTGKPKGVMIEHSSFLHYLLNNKTKYVGDIENNAGSYIHLSYTFDASLTAMFMPLLYGKPVIIGSGQSMDIFEDSNLLKYAPYDFIKITPSHLELLLPKFKAYGKDLLTAKLVIGGEALHAGQFNSFIESGIDVEIINEYGPTEATVGCTTYYFKTITDKDKVSECIPIGKPVDNTSIYILDNNNHLVPVGVKGELCIGGAGLARGYLNRPELTLEKFIKNPFSNNPGDRIYKTGDICRWLPDGNIEYLGRIDEQVKIRGYRIELGEIENALQQSSLVKQAVVLAKMDKEGNKRLIAYVVPNDDFDKAVIRTFVGSRLPDYMLPALWVELEYLPLTTNGKIDRNSLPNPDAGELLKGQFIAPRNELETRLADIWKEILMVERVGIHDNFIELGGHSLLVMRLISALRREFKTDLEISTFFELLTIEALANYIKVTQSNHQAESEGFDTIKL